MANPVTDIPWMTAAELVASYRARTLSPVEVARNLLERIERVDPQIHAFVTIDPDAVLDDARRAEAVLFRDEPLGVLHGVPVSIKDTIDTGGLRTTSGSLLWADRVPQDDAIVVERLRAAGAIILGKTNTPEFATFGRTVNRIATETRNPWDTARSPAGSSGGSGAALAAGLGPISIGTDAGGSIRFPAAFNGVFGLMPSSDLVPKRGCFESADFGSAFSSIGPLSRDVRDAAMTLQVVAGHDPRDPHSSRRAVPDYLAACNAGVEGLRIGWLAPPPEAHREAGVEQAIRNACEVFLPLGAAVHELEASLPDPFAVSATIMGAACSKLRRMAADEAALAKLTPYVAAMVRAPAPTAGKEAQAWSARRTLTERFDALFRETDLIASAVTCFPAPALPDEPFEMFVSYERYIVLPSMANVAGLAAASIPVGFCGGLPIGLMLMAPRGREDLLLRAAAAFERARPWANERPSLD